MREVQDEGKPSRSCGKIETKEFRSCFGCAAHSIFSHFSMPLVRLFFQFYLFYMCDRTRRYWCARSFKLWLFCELADRKLYSSYALVPNEKTATIENLYLLLCCFAVIFFSRVIKRCSVQQNVRKVRSVREKITWRSVKSIKLVEAVLFLYIVSLTIELIKRVYRMQSVYL